MAKKVETDSKKDHQVNSGKRAGKKNKADYNPVKRNDGYSSKVVNSGVVSESNLIRIVQQGSYGSNTAIILADATNKPENLMTPIEKMDIARIGVSKNDLESLKKIAGLGYDKLAKALSVTRATLINKKRKEKFNAALSERIVSLADIYSYGYEVFEDEKRFNQWMFRPNIALAGQAPYDLLDNQFGREEVRNIIGRIEFGVYS